MNRLEAQGEARSRRLIRRGRVRRQLFAESLPVIACQLMPVAGYIEFHDDAVVHQAVNRRSTNHYAGWARVSLYGARFRPDDSAFAAKPVRGRTKYAVASLTSDISARSPPFKRKCVCVEGLVHRSPDWLVRSNRGFRLFAGLQECSNNFVFLSLRILEPGSRPHAT
jgi:hypothetical protein